MHLNSTLLAVVLAALAGCANQPADTRERVSPYEAQRCVASAYDRAACVRYASQHCAANFEVFELDAPNEEGVERRAFHFRCL